MCSRGPYLPLHVIADADRYLISEISVAKALEMQVGSESIPLIEWLTEGVQRPCQQVNFNRVTPQQRMQRQ